MDQQNADTRAASRRLLATSERELQRIVLDMHDGPVQDIFAALSQLQVLERALAGDAGTQQRTRQAMRLLRSEEHTSELQSQSNLVCRLLLEKKKNNQEGRRPARVYT